MFGVQYHPIYICHQRELMFAILWTIRCATVFLISLKKLENFVGVKCYSVFAVLILILYWILIDAKEEVTKEQKNSDIKDN
jgi:cytosine/uracil/thiamine/allantoin permease